MITGLDLVQMQLRLARGDDFAGFGQRDVAAGGHAIEFRVYAENPAKNYLPAPGRLARADFPAGEGFRVDTGFEEGDEITPFYDPLIAKLIVKGADRQDAIARGRAMLADSRVEGLATNLALLRAVIDHPDFVAGRTFTDFLDVHRQELLAPV
jgi:acetyl/propionyl-CoA carboxylase alpha subunit